MMQEKKKIVIILDKDHELNSYTDFNIGSQNKTEDYYEWIYLKNLQ